MALAQGGGGASHPSEAGLFVALSVSCSSLVGVSPRLVGPTSDTSIHHEKQKFFLLSWCFVS